MSYENEISEGLGDHVYSAVLDAVDSGEISQIAARDIAKQLHPKVGGSFIHASMERNFTFNRRAMREILSNWYQFCVPEDPVKDLITALRHEDVQLEALANKLQRLNTKNVFHPQIVPNQGLWQEPNQYGGATNSFNVRQNKR